MIFSKFFNIKVLPVFFPVFTVFNISYAQDYIRSTTPLTALTVSNSIELSPENNHSESELESFVGKNDSIIDSEPDSIAQENEFQQDLNALFTNDFSDFDTFAWNTKRINSGRFEPKDWNDTARILLFDSLQCKKFVHPNKNIITSPFGQRGVMWHYGIDSRLSVGDTVHAAFDGIVRVKEYDRRGYGIVIVVRHSNGLETLYGHLSKTDLKPFDKVSAGDMIGLGGNTGRSTGPHLHFEIRYYGQPFDPEYIIDNENFCLKTDLLTLTKDNFAYLIELSKTRWHTIRRGETLGHIAVHYRTSVNRLCSMNKISRKTLLRPGKKLIVSMPKRTDNKLTLNTKTIKSES